MAWGSTNQMVSKYAFPFAAVFIENEGLPIITRVCPPGEVGLIIDTPMIYLFLERGAKHLLVFSINCVCIQFLLFYV